MSRSGTVDTPQTIWTQLFDGSETSYPQARIYDSSNTLVATVNLPHQVLGYYESTWTPTTTGQYKVVTIVYQDVARTIEDLRYNREGNTLVIVSAISEVRCYMTTTLVNSTDSQEVLCWLDIAGQTETAVSNARIDVTDGVTVLWSGNAATPDPRGVFFISQANISSLINDPDKNYAVCITIEFDGTDYTTVQPFYTVG